MRRVVITGTGMVSPIGNNAEDSWRQALQGESGIRKITHFDPSDMKVQIAAEVKDIDPSVAIDAKEISRTSRFCMFAAVAGKEAIKQSGLDYENSDTSRWGTSIGVGLGGLEDIEKATITLRDKGPRRVSPFFLPYAIPNMAAGLVSRDHRLKGPNICTTTACTSGTHGIGEAFLYIRQDMADVMVAGGSEAAISPVGVASFANMKALSADNDDPQRASRPFDRTRNGFVMGEGCGVLVIEELEHAKKRGAKIYAEVIGYGMSGDAHHITAPAEHGEGAQRCMRMALKTAQINPDQVNYINAHGTSTKLNDMYESEAIAAVFGGHAKDIAISSTKGVTGHCLGAAGGIEGVFAALSVADQIAPPTANFSEADPDCPLDYTVKGAREMKIDCALSNSFGFGGTNGTLVMRRFEG